MILFQGNMWTYMPWPSYFVKAFIRKRFKPETFGPTEEYRQSLFHKISLLYAFTAWTALGVGLYLFVYSDEIEEKEKKGGEELPYQKDIDKGGAMYWINALKSPEEMQNLQGIKVIKFQGLKYEGVEDVTVATKEIGQEKARRRLEKGSDYYLRKRLEIPMLDEGGPTNAEIREQFIKEGRDYELELDYSHQLYRIKTSYNPDGTVGDFISVSNPEQTK